MKSYAIAAAVAAAAISSAGSSALAADLPARTYTKAPPLVVQAYNWTGFYVGVNAGVGFGRSKTDVAIGGIADPSSRVGGLGGVGGGQIGYNWQYGSLLGFNNVVVGLEADIQGAGLDDNRTCAFICGNGTGININQKLDWFGTARGRIGVATGPVLSYFTGGFAYGNVKTRISDLTGAINDNYSSTRTGWTIGSGVEAALGGNWTGKVEYLYVDLGTQRGVNLVVPYAYNSQVREHIFRAGLNYRLGGVPYAAAPVANWSGWYVGGNGGSATALNKSGLQGLGGAVNEKFNLSPDGYFGGVQAGYNWQAGSVVYGLETDIQGGSLKDDYACQLSCTPGNSVLVTFNQKMQWFGTVRGRVGYSVGATLFYATGGFAYGGVKTDLQVAGFNGAPLAQSFSKTRTGYAVGGGIESPFNLFGLFGNNWTSKTEYLFVDLGKSTDAIAGTPLTFTTRAQEHMLRTGLNYHFNTPVVAKY
ncbi:MAG: outer membrane beta-barrel protein [Pseudomonadota bacterium]